MDDEQEIIEKIYAKALDFISHKSRSINETKQRLHRYLTRYKLSSPESEEVVGKVLKLLIDAGFLNDSKFVDEYIFSVQASQKPQSLKKMRMFLLQKGVSDGLISIGLSSVAEKYESSAALKDGENYFNRIKKSENSPYEVIFKLKSFLFRKGYSQNSIESVVDTILGVK